MLTGPTWHPAPRLAYVLLCALAAVAAAFFLVGGVFFGQSKLGFTLAGLVLLAVAVALGWLAAQTQRRYRDAAGLRSDGLEGTATVLGAGHAEIEHRGHPLLWLDLVVHVEGRPDYRTRVREFVPSSMVDRVARGEPLRVRIDPEQPSRMVIVWP